MKLTEEVYLVGSGMEGSGLTDEYDCNVYLINGGDRLALVDIGSGIDLNQILNNVTSEGFKKENIDYLLLTHAHADHCGGANKLKKIINVSVAISKYEAEFLRNGNEDEIGLTIARSLGCYPEDYHFDACKPDIELEDDMEISLGEYKIRVISTPGHSRGSVCYLMKGKEKTYLFAGDTVFCGGFVCLLNCVGCSIDQYRESMPKLANLGVNALLPGHFGFCLNYGQKHIDKAIGSFKSLSLPPSI